MMKFLLITAASLGMLSAAVAADPPITSAIFTLNPDGTTIVTPVLGTNGGPVQQIPEGVPEPSSLLLVLSGVLALTRLKK